MSSPNTYDQYDAGLQPPWLKGPIGEAFTSARGLMHDGAVEGAIAAVKARFIDTCPEDALSFIGSERNMSQFPGESTASYRTRLKTAWAIWPGAGTQPGLQGVLRYFLPNAYVVTNRTWSYPPSPGFNPGDEWWRFWVIVPQPHPFTGSWLWGTSTNWGASRTWGVTGPTWLLRTLQSLVAQWQSAHCTQGHFFFVVSGFVWGGLQSGGGAAQGFFNWGDGHVWTSASGNVAYV